MAYRHVPDGSPLGILDFRYAGLAADNRWNDAGEPTLYLASDPGVAGAEFWRHVDRDFRPDAVGRPLARRLYALRLHLPAVLDLRRPEVCRALALADAPHCFLDKPVARAVARYARVTTPAVAIWVPSVAFLDDLSRGSLVVFLDKLPADPAAFVVDVAEAGRLRFGP